MTPKSIAIKIPDFEGGLLIIIINIIIITIIIIIIIITPLSSLDT